MKYNGVTFVAEEARKMTEEEFIKAHLGNFWLDRDEETRRKMLADVYKRICGKKKKYTEGDTPVYGRQQLRDGSLRA